MPPDPVQRGADLISKLHGVFLAVLLALRGLVWDGDVFAAYHLVFVGAMLAAMFLLVVEVALGWRRDLRFSWAAAPVVLIAALLIPAALRSHLTVDAWAITGQVILHAAFGFWLMQVVPGRERIAWGALVAGLGAHALIAVMQWLTVMPAMRAQVASGDISVAGEGMNQSDLLERIANGGLFGTFTVSNALAAYLALVGIPLAAAWWAGNRRSLLMMGIVALAGLAFIGTNSKGMFLVIAAVVGLAWMIRLRTWVRWLPIAGGLVAVAAIIALPAVRAGLQASADVRLGYWQGAAQLVQESPMTGLGVTAFIERFPQVMDLSSEPTRLVHNEVLEAAVVGGIPLAALLAFVLLWIVWPKRSSGSIDPAPAAPGIAIGAAIGLITAYLAVFGAFSSNLGFWPGQSGLSGLGWAVLLAIALAIVAVQAQRVPLPAAWALRLGAAALALHALMDFDLHSFALVGTLLAVVILARPDRPLISVGWWWRAGLPLVWVALAIGFLISGSVAGKLDRSRELITTLRIIQGDAKNRQEGVESLARLLGQPDPADGAAFTALLNDGVAEAVALSVADPALHLRALALLPPDADRLARLDALADRLPYSSSLATQRSQTLLHLRRHDDAIAAQRRAVELSPASLPVRLDLARVLDDAARNDPAKAELYKTEAASIRAEVERLTPMVHPRNRPRSVDGK